MAHSDWTYTREHHLEIIRNLTSLIEHYFPNTPKYWTLGNHDSVPLNRLTNSFALRLKVLFWCFTFGITFIYKVLQNYKGSVSSGLSGTLTAAEDHLSCSQHLRLSLVKFLMVSQRRIDFWQMILLCSFAPHYVPERYQPAWVYEWLWSVQQKWIKSSQQSAVE